MGTSKWSGTYSLLAVMLAVASSLVAQTFVVDASNAAGTDFLSLSAAAVAVPDGSTLLVRSGSYSPFSLQAKGLTILAEPNTTVTGTSDIRDTTANQPVIVRGIDFDITPGRSAVLVVHSCAGRVLLENLKTPTALPPYVVFGTAINLPLGLYATFCDQLVVRDCALAGAGLQSCRAVFESCLLRGSSAAMATTIGLAREGLWVVGGAVEIVGNCTILGGGGLPGCTSNNAAGMRIVSAALNMRSGTVARGCGTASPATTDVIMLSPLTVEFDASVAFVPSSAFWQPSITRLPEVTSVGAALGGTMHAEVASLNSVGAGLMAALPSAPTVVTGIPGPIWLDPATLSLQALGVVQAGSPLGATLAVPNSISLRAATVAWQAVSFEPGGGLRATNPSLALIR
ncbi:MAG: hypothetical protein AB8H80_23765 [Planctomycetota bacterium]